MTDERPARGNRLGWADFGSHFELAGRLEQVADLGLVLGLLFPVHHPPIGVRRLVPAERIVRLDVDVGRLHGHAAMLHPRFALYQREHFASIGVKRHRLRPLVPHLDSLADEGQTVVDLHTHADSDALRAVDARAEFEDQFLAFGWPLGIRRGMADPLPCEPLLDRSFRDADQLERGWVGQESIEPGFG